MGFTEFSMLRHGNVQVQIKIEEFLKAYTRGMILTLCLECPASHWLAGQNLVKINAKGRRWAAGIKLKVIWAVRCCLARVCSFHARDTRQTRENTACGAIPTPFTNCRGGVGWGRGT